MLGAYGNPALSKVYVVLGGSRYGFQSLVTILLVSLLALPPEAAAQTPAPANRAGAPPVPNLAPLPVESLTVYVLDGQGEVHDIHNRVTSTPVVEVRDGNGQPVEGADVTFDLPALGPGGAFAGQQFTFTAKTNFQGQAAATFTPNLETGRFNIRVTAKQGNQTGHAVIRQTNGLRSGRTETKSGLFKFAWWKVAVLAGAGAAVGVVLATRGSSSGPSVTLIPGTPTFGAP